MICLIQAQTGNTIIAMCGIYGKTELKRAKQGQEVQTVLNDQGGIRKDHLVEKITQPSSRIAFYNVLTS